MKIPEKVLGGVYANQMMIRHTREEFVLDFINRFPPQGVVAARVIDPPYRDGYTEFDLANVMYGGNFTSRINTNLREEKGWSYGVR